MMKSLSIIIPAHNEEDRIVDALHKLIDFLTFSEYVCQIIVVDDGSTDSTYELTVAEAGKMENHFIKAIRYSEAKGKGYAVKKGVENSDADYILFMDADMQILPEEIPCFMKLLECHNAHAVIGSKRHYASHVSYSIPRWIISQVYYCMCRLLFHLKLRDTQVGFKLFRAAPLKRAMSKVLVKKFAFDIEVLVTLKDNGFRIIEAPVRLYKRTGAGSASIKNIYETFKDTLAVFYRRCIGWYEL